MTTLHTPWTIHEAEVALFPAWRDGMPFAGPGSRGAAAPVFLAKAGLTITETPRHATSAAHDWTGAQPTAESEYEITVAFPDGAFSDSLSRVHSHLPAGGLHVLVLRFWDESTSHWTLLRFFYVTIESDEGSVSGEVMARSMRLKSTWLQETTGTGIPPAMVPQVLGEVEWVCGSRRITCLTYDPVAELWASTPQNATGSSGTLLVNFAPVDGCSTDVALSAFFPRVIAGAQASPALAQAAVEWSNLVLARIGNHASAVHHGLALFGLSVQAAGIAEPLCCLPQARMLDEPVIVFRYLRRVYATLGHGVLAVPALVCSGQMPFTHDPPFRLAIPGDPNPATGQSGLTLFPNGAWLDGALA